METSEQVRKKIFWIRGAWCTEQSAVHRMWPIVRIREQAPVAQLASRAEYRVWLGICMSGAGHSHGKSDQLFSVHLEAVRSLLWHNDVFLMERKIQTSFSQAEAYAVAWVALWHEAQIYDILKMEHMAVLTSHGGQMVSLALLFFSSFFLEFWAGLFIYLFIVIFRKGRQAWQPYCQHLCSNSPVLCWISLQLSEWKLKWFLQLKNSQVQAGWGTYIKK